MAFEMSTESLRKHCRKLNLYSSRLDLNDILHLQCKGITKIQGLEEFTGLTTLYLESNAISDIEGLEPVVKLTSLYIAKNFLSRTTGLGILVNLQVSFRHGRRDGKRGRGCRPPSRARAITRRTDSFRLALVTQVLDLADNNLSNLEDLSELKQLRTLNVSGNKLTDLASISEVARLPELISLDLSKNRLGKDESKNEDEAIVDFLCTLKLKWMRLVENPFLRRVRGYRKVFVGKMATLNYFDDMPAFPKDRRLSLAYLSGGVAAEREERKKINQEERERREERARDFDRLVNEAKERAKTNPIKHDPSIFRAKEPEPVPEPEPEPAPVEEVAQKEEEEEGGDGGAQTVSAETTEAPSDAMATDSDQGDSSAEEGEATTSESPLESHPLDDHSESEEEGEGDEQEETSGLNPYAMALQSHLSDINSLDKAELKERQAKHRSEILQREFTRASLSIESRATNQNAAAGAPKFRRPVIWGTSTYKQLWASAAAIPDPPEEPEDSPEPTEPANTAEVEAEDDPDSINAQYRALLDERALYSDDSETESSVDPMEEFTTTNMADGGGSRRREGPRLRRRAARRSKSSRGSRSTSRPWIDRWVRFFLSRTTRPTCVQYIIIVIHSFILFTLALLHRVRLVVLFEAFRNQLLRGARRGTTHEDGTARGPERLARRDEGERGRAVAADAAERRHRVQALGDTESDEGANGWHRQACFESAERDSEAEHRAEERGGQAEHWPRLDHREPEDDRKAERRGSRG